MTFRICLAVLVCAVAGAHAETYLRGERFGTVPRAWKQTTPAQFYGFEQTDITGNNGAAGGILQPTTYFNRYADIFLGGTLSRGTPVTASGWLVVERVSMKPPYVATAYIGHFSQQFDKFVHTIGIALTGLGTDLLAAQAIVEFSDGTAYVGEEVSVQAEEDAEYLDWTYDWQPGGGAFGQGLLTVTIGGVVSLIDVPSAAAGKQFALDAFGLFQPRFSDPDTDSFIQLYIGDVAYTAFVGLPPKVRVRGPGQIRTSGPTIDLSGTAKVAVGNRIKSVRYRVIQNGKPSRYRNASGTDKWTATIRVPKGGSRIEVLARSDSGLTGTSEVRVRRR